MSQLSYNTINNKRLQTLGISKGVKLVALLVLIYTAGYFTPGIQYRLSYGGAESKARAFIANVTADNYQAARDLGTAELQEQFEDGDELKASMGNLKSDAPKYGKKATVPGEDTLVYRQVVDNLPETENGLTDAIFTVTMAKEGKQWQVANVAVN